MKHMPLCRASTNSFIVRHAQSPFARRNRRESECKAELRTSLAVKSTRTAFLFAFFEAFGVFHGTIFGIKTIRLSSGEIFIANKTTGNWPSMRLRLL